MTALKHYPFTGYTLFALGLLLGTVVTYVLLLSEYQQQQQVITEHVQSLTNNAAQEAVDPLFRKDLLSLQTLMHRLSSNPYIASADIQSIDQQTLAHSGLQQRKLTQQHTHFKAAITLSDSIAGFVSVTSITPGNDPYFTLFLSLITSCVVVLIWPLRHLFVQVSATLSRVEQTQNSESEIEDTPILTQENETEEPTVDNEQAYLAVVVKNMATLQQQLSGTMFRQTVSALETRIQQIAALYGAHHTDWREDRWIITIVNEQHLDACFNACCAGRLILDLASIINKVPVDICVQVSAQEQDLEGIDMPFVGLAFNCHDDNEETLNEKLEWIAVSEEDTQRKLVSAFKAPYETLLQRQMAQFK